MDDALQPDNTDGSQWGSLALPDLREFIERNQWIYARTMPEHPHEYVVLQKCTLADSFFQFAMTIRRFGYDEYFFSKKIRYFDVDRRRYWTMGDLLVTTCVLNRAMNTRPDIPWSLNKTPFITNPPAV